jgi:hypothetical protein
MPERGFAIRVPAITHERLDDEVIAINLETGIYYALVGPAADVWSCFDPAGSAAAASTALAARYGVSADEIRPEVDAFTRRLEAAGLLADVEAPDSSSGALPSTPPETAWAAHELEEYRDMADLVLLDPIHQVDEAGWPHLPEPPG